MLCRCSKPPVSCICVNYPWPVVLQWPQWNPRHCSAAASATQQAPPPVATDVSSSEALASEATAAPAFHVNLDLKYVRCPATHIRHPHSPVSCTCRPVFAVSMSVQSHAAIQFHAHQQLCCLHQSTTCFCRQFPTKLHAYPCREHVEELAENCRRRNSQADPALVAALYDEFVALDREADAVRKERNDNAASMKVLHTNSFTFRDLALSLQGLQIAVSTTGCGLDGRERACERWMRA